MPEDHRPGEEPSGSDAAGPPARSQPRADPEEAPTEIDFAASSAAARLRGEVPQRIGPYRIDGELGRGGMGVVWRGMDERLGRAVALKTIGERLNDAEALQRFVQEAQLLAQLSHPNLATVFDLPEHDGRPVLVMELLDGESLFQRLQRAPLGVTETIRMGAQVAAGLAMAHEHSIVHRDLKPANIQALSSGDYKVLDFGLARSWAPEHGDAEGRVLAGTPGYMSPEQVRCEDVDGRSDLFALGVVLFESLTGELCFVGGTVRARMAAVLDAEPDWSALPDDLPESLSKTVRDCLSPEPERRPADAAQVRDVLQAELRRIESAPVLLEATDAPGAETLPAEQDEFLGRESELDRLTELAEAGARLVSVLGPGGIGKTRLVTRHAKIAIDRYPGGAWFCDLSEAASIDGIVHAVAGTLGVTLGRDDPVERLGHAIAGRGECLVVLDNFEQVADHAAETIGVWLAQATEARFVVTTRQVLGLVDESVLEVEALSPDGAALHLFESRARTKLPSFGITDENRASVRELVKLLDGMPLAIELAAARMRVLSLAQLVERMQDRFRLLSGPGGTGRQATLRATVEWSWDLLETWEQAALAQASVFDGGFTLEAAEAVIDLSAHEDAPWTLDVLEVLVDKSLLRTWSTAGDGSDSRFGTYLSIREHAAEKLRTDGAVPGGQSGADAERVAFVRHGDYFACHGSLAALAALDQTGGVGLRRALTAELQNLIVACRRAVARGDGSVATSALAATCAVLFVSGSWRAASSLGEDVLAMDGLEPEQRGRALGVSGQACWRLGRWEIARDRMEEALAVHHEVGDRWRAGQVLANLGALEVEHGSLERAQECCEQALAIHREVGNRVDEANVLANLGVVYRHRGDVDRAQELYGEALTIHREVGNRRGQGNVLTNLGSQHYLRGELDESQAALEEALAAYREVGARGPEGIVLGNLGLLYQERGVPAVSRTHYLGALRVHRETGSRTSEANVLIDLGDLHGELGRMEEAWAELESALDIAREVHSPRFEARAHANLAKLHRQAGRPEEAREHYMAELAIAEDAGDRRTEGCVLRDLGTLQVDEGRLDEARGVLVKSESLLRETSSAIDLGLALVARGRLEIAAGDETAARVYLEEAESMVSASSLGPESELGRSVLELSQELARDTGPGGS